MDRRKTLGGLSPGQLNSRASLAPGRVMNKDGKGGWGGGAAGPGKPLDKALARLSLAGPVQRRSSAYTTKAPGVKSDPRPVGDKLYQQNCIRTVITFLASHGYEYQVTPKVLASPTTKDFTNLMTFLVRQIDANLMKGLGKLEEEVPQLYKRLRYPFQISKSNLTAVGSPHTWPTILAAITWLVELLNYQERAESARAEMDERVRGEADFFDYVSQAYRFFMAGDDARCDEVDGEKAGEFQARAGQVVAEAERLAAANDALRAEIEGVRAAPSPAAAARVRRDETAADRDKFVKLIENLQTHKASLTRKLAERSADVAAQHAELAALEREHEGLRARIAAQTIHPADVLRMNQDKTKHEAALRGAVSQREALDARVAAEEAEVARRLEGVDGALAEYHGMADRLALVPASAKRAEGVAFEVRLDRDAGSASEMINVDLKGLVKPALQRLRDGYAGRARGLAEELLSLQEKRDGGLELLAERAEENANAEAHVRRLEAQFRAGREAVEAEVASAAAAVEALAEEVAGLRNANGATVAEGEERLRALQAEHEELQRACEAETGALHRDLSSALEAVLNHKLAVQARLKETRDRVAAVRQEVVAAAA